MKAFLEGNRMEMGIQTAAVVRFLQGDFAGFFLTEHQKEWAKFLLQQISRKPPAGAILADRLRSWYALCSCFNTSLGVLA